MSSAPPSPRKRPFAFSVNHNRLDAVVGQAERRARKPGGKKGRPVRPTPPAPDPED